MATPLADLDELVLRCRDDRAKGLIAEAVNSYKTKAFRAAIVATWIAVSFDLIEKLRDLALAGDASAEKHVEKLERIRLSNDISAALAFERDLLRVARDDFELISPVEFIDLERLQADRHRCAHPSLSDERTPYSPSAELVRAHIVSAVDHVLRHPPVQGKYALQRLLLQIDSEYFPTRKQDALEALSVGPLRRARESLVRNLVVVLAKAILKEGGRQRFRRLAALKAVSEMYPAVYADTISKKLSQVLRSSSDESLFDELSAVSEMPHAWDLMEADVQQRFRNLVAALPSKYIGGIEWLLRFAPVAGEARRRVARATRKELQGEFFFAPPKELLDRFISIYLSSASFDEANEWAKELIGYKDEFSSDHLKTLFGGVLGSADVSGSFRLPDLIRELRNAEVVDFSVFDDLLRGCGLGQYCPVD